MEEVMRNLALEQELAANYAKSCRHAGAKQGDCAGLGGVVVDNVVHELVARTARKVGKSHRVTPIPATVLERTCFSKAGSTRHRGLEPLSGIFAPRNEQY